MSFIPGAYFGFSATPGTGTQTPGTPLDIAALADGGPVAVGDEFVVDRSGSNVKVSYTDTGIPDLETRIGETAAIAVANQQPIIDLTTGKQDLLRENPDDLVFEFRDPAGTGDFTGVVVEAGTEQNYAVTVPAGLFAKQTDGLADLQVLVVVDCGGGGASEFELTLRDAGGTTDLAGFDAPSFSFASGDARAKRSVILTGGELPQNFRILLSDVSGTTNIYSVAGIIYGWRQRFSGLADTPSDLANPGDLLVVDPDGTGLEFEPPSAGLGGGTTVVTTDTYGWELHADHTDQRGGWARESGGITYLYLPNSPASGDQEIFVYNASGVLRQRLTFPDVPRIADVWADVAADEMWIADNENCNVVGYDLPALHTGEDVQNLAPSRKMSIDFYSGHANGQLEGLTADVTYFSTIGRKGTTLGRVRRYRRTDLTYDDGYNLLSAPYPRDAVIFDSELFVLVPSASTIRRINLSLLSDQTVELNLVDGDGITLTPTGMARDANSWWVVDSNRRVNGYDAETSAFLIPGQVREASETVPGTVTLAPLDQYDRGALDSDQVVTAAGLGDWTTKWLASVADYGLARYTDPIDLTRISESERAVTPYSFLVAMSDLITPTIAHLRTQLDRPDQPTGPIYGVPLVENFGDGRNFIGWAYRESDDRLYMVETTGMVFLDPILLVRISALGTLGGTDVLDLAVDEASGTLYGVSDARRLVRFDGLDTLSPTPSFVSTTATNVVVPDAEYDSSWGDDWCCGMFFFQASSAISPTLYICTPNNIYAVDTTTGVGGRVFDQPATAWGTALELSSAFPQSGEIYGLFESTGHATLATLTSAGAVRNQVQTTEQIEFATGSGPVQMSEMRKGSCKLIAGRPTMVRDSDDTLWRVGAA